MHYRQRWLRPSRREANNSGTTEAGCHGTTEGICHTVSAQLFALKSVSAAIKVRISRLQPGSDPDP
ncbi:MAG: hypothetical protein QJR08_01235 [Bacillota bacterium]|nr:hypothetical protein [Bacillota bacterium]